MFFLLLSFLLFSFPAWPGVENTLSTGKIYYPLGATEHSYLYESKTILDGAKETVHTTYKDKEGKALVEEETLYQGGKVQKYTYQQLQMKEGGEVRVRGSKVFYEFTNAEGKKREAEDDWKDNMVVPADLQRIIKDRWKELKAGETIKVSFLLVERQDDITFKIFHDGETTYADRKASKFVMKPANFLIAAVAPSFELVVDEAPSHRLLESFGRLPIRVPEVKDPKKRKDYAAIDAKLVLDSYSELKETPKEK